MLQKYLIVLCVSLCFIQHVYSKENLVNLTLTKENEDLVNMPLTHDQAEEVLSVLENKFQRNKTGADYQDEQYSEGM